MTKTVEQLERELAAMTGERNAWREMATQLMNKQQPVVFPQIQPLRVEPIITPLPYIPCPSYPWGGTGITFTTDSTDESVINASDGVSFLRKDGTVVSLEDLCANIPNTACAAH